MNEKDLRSLIGKTIYFVNQNDRTGQFYVEERKIRSITIGDCDVVCTDNGKYLKKNEFAFNKKDSIKLAINNCNKAKLREINMVVNRYSWMIDDLKELEKTL